MLAFFSDSKCPPTAAVLLLKIRDFGTSLEQLKGQATPLFPAPNEAQCLLLARLRPPAISALGRLSGAKRARLARSEV